MEFKMKISFTYFRFMILFFFGDGFYYNLNSLGENVSRNEWDAFKKRGMHFIPININSLLPKIDKARYIANKPMCLLLDKVKLS